MVKRFRFDPRLYQLLNNSLLIITAFLFFELQRSPAQIILTIVTGIAVEIALATLLRPDNKSFTDRTLSSLNSSLSTLVLIRSNFIWLHPVAVTIALASKYFIRFGPKHHSFNPTNFAIIFCYAFFDDWISFYPDEFSLSIWPTLITIFIGTIATIRVDRWILPYGYLFILGFLTLSLWFLGYNKAALIGPELGASGLVFLFFMVTDPQTTPSSRKGQVLFTLSLIAFTVWGRLNELLSAHFLGLFLTSFFWNFNYYWRRIITTEKA